MFRTTVVAMASGRKISISLEHMKVATKIGRRYGYSVCVDETQKVMDTLEAANFFIQPIYKYVKAVDDCVEKLREERMKPKATTLYHLSKYVNQRKHKKK